MNEQQEAPTSEQNAQNKPHSEIPVDEVRDNRKPHGKDPENFSQFVFGLWHTLFGRRKWPTVITIGILALAGAWKILPEQVQLAAIQHVLRLKLSGNSALAFELTEMTSGTHKIHHIPSGISHVYPSKYNPLTDGLAYGSGEWQIVVNAEPVEEGAIFRIRPIPLKRRTQSFEDWVRLRFANTESFLRNNRAFKVKETASLRIYWMEGITTNESGRDLFYVEAWIPINERVFLEVRSTLDVGSAAFTKLSDEIREIVESVRIRGR